MKITSKGQVTIPIEFREKLGFLPETEVEFELVKDTVIVKKAAAGKHSRAEPYIRKIRGSATVKLSTEEILNLTRGENS